MNSFSSLNFKNLLDRSFQNAKTSHLVKSLRAGIKFAGQLSTVQSRQWLDTPHHTIWWVSLKRSVRPSPCVHMCECMSCLSAGCTAKDTAPRMNIKVKEDSQLPILTDASIPAPGIWQQHKYKPLVWYMCILMLYLFTLYRHFLVYYWYWTTMLLQQLEVFATAVSMDVQHLWDNVYAIQSPSCSRSPI